MSKILFLSYPFQGHLGPLLTVALKMRSEGHDVSFVVPGWRIRGRIPGIFGGKNSPLEIPRAIEAHGISLHYLPPPMRGVSRVFLTPFASGYGELCATVKSLPIGAESFTEAIRAHVEVHRPDAMVADCWFYASHLAAELTDTPCAVVYHCGLPFKGPLVPPYGSGLPIGCADAERLRPFVLREAEISGRLDDRVNALRKRLGLPPCAPGALRRPYSKWLNLALSAEAAEAPRDPLPANTLYIGPCFRQGAALSDQTFPFEKLDPGKRKVYISLGTVFSRRPWVFRKIMAALDHPEYQVIVSAGAGYPLLAIRRNPANAMLFHTVPQMKLLPLVDLVISHGGNNTLNESLAAGKPLMVLPIGGEQTDNASRIEYLKVGHRLNLKSYSREEVKRKADDIIGHPDFAERAKTLKAALAETDGCAVASRCIGWLATHRRPLCRPAGLPLTIGRDSVEALMAKAAQNSLP